MTRAKQDITICEVGPRDGLQTEPYEFSVEERIALIERLAGAGLKKIEAVSFVNPKAVPRMAHAEEVLAGLTRRQGVEIAGLAMNLRGAEHAVASGVDELRFVVISTDTFNKRNQGVGVTESLAAFRDAAAVADRNGTRPVGIVAAAFGCPLEGPVHPDVPVSIAEDMYRHGAEQIVFADTIGAGVPTQIEDVLTRTRQRLGQEMEFGIHLHNTRNTGYANAIIALGAGASILDSSIGGMGGCPFAPKATGNIATEDLVYMLRNMGLGELPDLDGLIETVTWLEDLRGHALPGQLTRARPFPECIAITD